MTIEMLLEFSSKINKKLLKPFNVCVDDGVLNMAGLQIDLGNNILCGCI